MQKRPQQRSHEKWDTERSIVDLFEDRVEKHPNRIAVKTDDAEIRYRDLNATANRIARTILERHDGTSVAIAMFMNHGPDKIAAAMGVFKAGLAYVSLDTDYHEQGAADLVQHAESQIILTDSVNYKKAQSIASSGATVIDVTEIRPGDLDENIGKSIDPDGLAFILYTSGSTGRPKGVVFTHKAALHGARRGAKALDIGQDDRVAFFDAFWIMVFGGTLISGGCLYPYCLKKSGLSRASAWLHNHRITIYPGYPTAFRQITDTLDGPAACSSIRRIYLVGEPIYNSDFASFRKYFDDDCVFVSGYGSSEFVCAATNNFKNKDDVEIDLRRVGHPQSGVELLILDDAQKPRCDGEPGEIAIRSQFLTSGYWRRPDITGQVYLTEGMSDDVQLFRTGDLGHIDASGCLYMLGRKDAQIKIRNHRVQPSEIEDAILQHKAIKASAVTTFENAKGDLRLAAYVVPQTPDAISELALRDYARHRLPYYMIPSIFILLDELPQTKTGKIDRRALPLPKTVTRHQSKNYRPPRTSLETDLRDIWQSLLGLSGIGTDDDFFDLGGDSLQATRLIIEVADQFEIGLEPELIFESSSTIRGMAREISQRRKVGQGQSDSASIAYCDLPKTMTTSQLITERARNVDFVEFNVAHHVSSKAELYTVESTTSLRRARPLTKMGPIAFNSKGFRSPEIASPKPAGSVRLAFLGSSDTLDSFAASNETTWPYRVWRNLCDAIPGQNFDYINAGLPGYHTKKIALMFEHHVAELEPNVIFVSANDLNVDSAYMARRSGNYSGAHYKPSWLARRYPNWSRIELNLVILKRLACAHSSKGKLQFDPRQLSRDYETRLEELVRRCQAKSKMVILLSQAGRLRREQNWWQQIRSATTNVLYMPYMSIAGILDGRDEYRRVVAAVADRTKSLHIDAGKALPESKSNYVDSNHLNASGSKRLADHIARILLSNSNFQNLLTDDK